MRDFGRDCKQEQCLAAAKQLRQHVPDAGGSKQAAALIVLAGLADPAAMNR